jgi:hypothetical protein
MMRKRSGKFYSNNEKKTLESLGFVPSPMSGAGWIVKEDGENDVAMVQLKSTDSSSYRLDILDMKKLEYHAYVSNKVPIFLVQFLKQDKVYAIVDVSNIDDLFEAFNCNKKPEYQKITKIENKNERKMIRSSKKSRDEFMKERNDKYTKRK